jgi:hypothetical protein
MKIAYPVLVALGVTLLMIGCGGAIRSPLSMFKFADVSPDLAGVVSSAVQPTEDGVGVKFVLTQIFDGDNPTGFDREVRVFSPELVSWALGNLTPGQRVELEGAWMAVSGPAYFAASKIEPRRSTPSDWDRVMGSKLAQLAAGALGLSASSAALPVPRVTVLDRVPVAEANPVTPMPPAKVEKVELPERADCAQFWELMSAYRLAVPPKNAEAVELARLCVK